MVSEDKSIPPLLPKHENAGCSLNVQLFTRPYNALWFNRGIGSDSEAQ